MRPSLKSWVATTARNVLSSVVTLFVEHLYFPCSASEKDKLATTETNGLHPLLPELLDFISDITKSAVVNDSKGTASNSENVNIAAADGIKGVLSFRSRANEIGAERTDSELLARIGMVTLYELTIALSSVLSREEFNGSTNAETKPVMSKEYLWGQIANVLNDLMEYSLATDFGSVPQDAGNLTDDEDDDEE